MSYYPDGPPKDVCFRCQRALDGDMAGFLPKWHTVSFSIWVDKRQAQPWPLGQHVAYCSHCFIIIGKALADLVETLEAIA